MVSTVDFESSDPSSNLGGTYPIKHGLIPVFILFFFWLLKKVQIEFTEFKSRWDLSH